MLSAGVIRPNQEMLYMDLIRKLEKRFGFRELPETAQVQFNNARQWKVLLCWTLYHSFLSPVPTVLLPIFSPNSYL
jgi:hypothetical protein